MDEGYSVDPRSTVLLALLNNLRLGLKNKIGVYFFAFCLL